MRMLTANWARNVTFRAAHVHQPASLDELRALVERTAKIRALGTGHSFNLVADTTADLVMVDGLPGTVEIDREASTATVAAGLRYAEVAVALEREGFALANLASLPHISVAGSVATGTHGSGDGQQSLAGAVAALTLVAPDGTLVDVHRDADPGAIVALGALGVVTALTLDIEPTFQVAQQVYRTVPLEEIGSAFDAVFGSAYSVSAFTAWASGEAVVWQKRRVDGPEPAWRGAHPATEPVNPVPSMPAANATQQLGLAGPWHERLPHFRPEFTPSAGEELQSEFFVPRAHAATAIAALGEIGELIASVLQISEIRTVRADDLWLSPAYHRDSVTFHFTWVRDALAVAPVLAQVEQRLLPLEARPHWGKLTSIPADTIVASYPCAPDFAALLRRFDPDGKFRNSFVDDLFPLT